MFVLLFPSPSLLIFLAFSSSPILPPSLLLQYTITSCCADIAVPKSWRNKPGASFSVSSAYVFTDFAYQIGNFLSRSSLSLLTIRRLWILTLIQITNLGLWLLQDAV